jgi:hypothetical protein
MLTHITSSLRREGFHISKRKTKHSVTVKSDGYYVSIKTSTITDQEMAEILDLTQAKTTFIIVNHVPLTDNYNETCDSLIKKIRDLQETSCDRWFVTRLTLFFPEVEETIDEIQLLPLMSTTISAMSLEYHINDYLTTKDMSNILIWIAHNRFISSDALDMMIETRDVELINTVLGALSKQYLDCHAKISI